MHEFFFDLSIILVGSAVLASLAVVMKQPIILAYIVCGILVGPWGLGWVHDVHFMESISHLGVTLLLFLTGLCLHPQKLLRLFGKASLVTLANSVISFLAGFGISTMFGYSSMDSICIGLAMMFSSTILVVKLLPTTELHHQRMGAFCIGILILQDLIAVAVLVFVRCLSVPDEAIQSFFILSGKVVLFIGGLVVFEYYILRRIMEKVDQLHEALFVLGLAWCFGMATISDRMGLFYETGAFFSGVVLARHAISRFISEELKPIRDFFLVLFFFTLGAGLDLKVIKDIYLPTFFIVVFFLFAKPWLMQCMLIFSGEHKPFAREAGGRLGQLSEFSLLIGMLAFQLEHISREAVQLIQFSTILTFVFSSYYVCRTYPTPIGVAGQLKQD